MGFVVHIAVNLQTASIGRRSRDAKFTDCSGPCYSTVDSINVFGDDVYVIKSTHFDIPSYIPSDEVRRTTSVSPRQAKIHCGRMRPLTVLHIVQRPLDGSSEGANPCVAVLYRAREGNLGPLRQEEDKAR